MNIIFLHHSCFLIETEGKVLLFDWFAKDRVDGFQFGGIVPEYEPQTPFYVFASHKHRDHFDMDVLRWVQKYPNIRYIFSRDCKMSDHFLEKHGISAEVKKRIRYVGCGEKIQVDDLKIETFLSTDAGVAFYVETAEACIYHAGDLYNWKWDGAGDLVNGRMEAAYKSHVRRISQKRIDLAFVPLDPRLGPYQSAGMEYFIQNTLADMIFPMHMWQDYSGITKLQRKLSRPAAERIVQIHSENEVFYYEKNRDFL